MIASRLQLPVLALLLVAGTLLPRPTSADDAIPPVFMPEGSYVGKNLDGSDPYGDQGIEIGVDVTFDGYENGYAVYSTRGWLRPVGGAKQYQEGVGEIRWDLETQPDYAELQSSSNPNLSGELWANDDGTFTADYSSTGGNTRVWHPE